MSIEQINKIDFISLRKGTKAVILTISDHLDWTDVGNHLQVLQDKINTYLSFCESGEIYDSYPNAENKNIVIEIKAKYPLSIEGEEFFEQAKDVIQGANIGLRFSLAEEE